MSESKMRISAEDRRAYIWYAVTLTVTVVLLFVITYFALKEKSFSVSNTVSNFLMTLSGSIIALLALMYIVDIPVSRTRYIVRNVCLTVMVAAIVFSVISIYIVEKRAEVDYPITLIYALPTVIVCGIVFGMRYAYLNAAVLFVSLCIWYPLPSLGYFFLVIVLPTAVFSAVWYLLREYRQEIRCACTVLVTLLTFAGYKLGNFESSFTDLEFLMYYVLPVTVTTAVVMIVYLLFKRINTMRENYRVERQNLRMSKEIQDSVMAAKQYADDDLTFSADMRTSSDIGGDFYDTFTNNSGLRFFIIGDVSGKNMPAAMSMMETMAFAEAASMDVNSPAEVMSTVNRLFCRTNTTEQFVTMWIGAYDSNTCTLYHSNAGHMFPLLRRNGTYSELIEERGPAVGFDDSSEYPVNVTSISDGDSVFLYTDGVTEAFNPSGEAFGKERTIGALNSCNGPVIDGIFSKVMEFSEGRQLSDDLTAVSISFTGCEVHSAQYRSEKDRLYDIQDFIGHMMETIGFDGSTIVKAQVASEEIFINICRYAYLGETGDVEVMCRRNSNGILITFIDNGVPFNPLVKIDPDTDIQFDRKEGGFGIYMTKKLCDSVNYRYLCGKNVFTMSFKLRSDNEKVLSE